jgi:transcriptional regulator with XRE-family HTH domain
VQHFHEKLRAEHGIRLSYTLAEIAGYDESYIRQMERGTKSATLRTLSNLATAFSISVSVLIRRAESRVTKRH